MLLDDASRMLKWVHHPPSLPKNHTTPVSSVSSNDSTSSNNNINNNSSRFATYVNDTESDKIQENALITNERICYDGTVHPRRRIGGSDPRVATCRGKLQNKRSKLNQEINKELRLRAGAENLFKATTNRKLKETVALELSFVNSNLQLLKEQLAELNSSVELYQNESEDAFMPLIPLGLKETKDIDFRDPFKDFILEHYSEDGENYEEAIAELMETRQATRTPTRDTAGIGLLLRYYNQLYFIERRFFPPERSLGIYFEWYDSLTGVPSCQRTVAFEKASVLFNAGALYTQLAAKQDRRTARGLDQAIDAFLRSAGTFRYIHENFTNAPSMDLGPDMLDMLVQLMLAQARECLFEKLELQSRESRDIDVSLDIAQEAVQVSAVYGDAHTLISREPVRDYVPESWISLISVKREHYLALSHRYCAAGLLNHLIGDFRPETRITLERIQESDSKTQMDCTVPKADNERQLLGQAHIREALVLHEESQRLQRMCRELKSKQSLAKVLKNAQDFTMEIYGKSGDEDDLRELLDAPNIIAATKFQLSLTHPDFGQHGVDDLFRSLGPVAIFSAKRHWTAPRLIQLQRGPGGEGFGFSVRGDAPVIIAAIDHNSLADLGGMKEGDFIVTIGDKDVKWASHEQVVRLIKQSGDSISLKLVTPMDRNYLKKPIKDSSRDKGSVSASSSSGISSGQPSPAGSVTTAHVTRRLPWNPFKKSNGQRDSRDLTFDNVILR
ncbi:PREDICTED: rhophilin-2 [Ceratosolen solmsi marchali]|uniref:Rhophilin-2 n=1 Tax=Ceratosolen solmsi marchali TaxID=326594 RepID=A0AAJ6YJR3_9HYME|nr:PREDICTED: rhophilin-2 [Ceratosolen solmsi marchali]